ncbi:MAG: low molecular weight protein-tyrosine-phosphatase [Pseudanabaenaceae cyanobacterium bins.68]|nr:low molecular weight protein-tyrosine-phosphatase [Pseudanabaenaceae cyanobacterium bins.68]
MLKILFVCLGNICRSPAAENIMNNLIQQNQLQDLIECDSAGTAGYHIGSPPDSRMSAAAHRRGLKFVGAARQFSRQDFAKFDLILAMDQANYRNILALDPGDQFGDKVKMMCTYCTKYSDREVPDPYYGGEQGFEYVLDLLDDACKGLLAELKSSLE